MRKISIGVLTVLIGGCAHFEDKPKVVQFPYASELLKKVQQGASRFPASTLSMEDSQKSPRRVYFSTLYHQYLTLGNHLRKKTEIQFCPQFHHDKLKTDQDHIPKVSFFSSSQVNEEGKEFFPELVFNHELSLGNYHLSIREELETLCEEGVSNNFYKFDNLVTHYSNNKSFHRNPKAMNSVLKIPVFANFYLVKMLEAPGFDSTSTEEKEFIKLTNTYWFDNYVAEAHKMRTTFIKNKMVRR